MNTLRLLVAILIMAAAVSGQWLPGQGSSSGVVPTRIGQHQMGESIEEWYKLEPPDEKLQQIAPHHLGETFAEWLSLNNLNMGEICGKHSRNDKAVDYKAVCKRLSEIRDSGAGTFFTESERLGNIGWRFSDGKVADYQKNYLWYSQSHVADTNDGMVREHGQRMYAYSFIQQKLSEIAITTPSSALSFSDEIALLTNTYGKPAEVKTVPYQNGYGAHWERSEVVWMMPDGTTIMASERTEFNQPGLLGSVMFLSKEALAALGKSKPTTNPYK